MSTTNSTDELTALFGKPDDDSKEVWDTGFVIVGIGIASILESGGKPTDYFVSRTHKQIIDSKGRIIGHLNGEIVPFILDLEGNRTNYFLNGAICPKVMYASNKYLQS